MRHDWSERVHTLSAASAAALLLAVPVAGQVPTAPAQAQQTAPAKATKPWNIPRVADGRPDLQGVWNFSTATPLERPRALAGKQVLSDEEAAEFEAQEAQRHKPDLNPLDIVGNYNEFWYDGSKKVVGPRRTSLIIDPPDGQIPPLTPEAQRRQEAVAEARRGLAREEPTPGGWIEDVGPTHLKLRCILGFNSGPPWTPGGYNQNVQIFQVSGYVVILNEMIHNARIVPMDGRPHGTVRQWAGDSRGRWQGDTLVVDTINFRGAPLMGTRELSADMHLVERFTRIDADTLLYEFTIEDPTTWTKPWTAQIPMTTTQDHMYEYACHEGNYGLYNILAGARAKEKADEEAAKQGLK